MITSQQCCLRLTSEMCRKMTDLQKWWKKTSEKYFFSLRSDHYSNPEWRLSRITMLNLWPKHRAQKGNAIVHNIDTFVHVFNEQQVWLFTHKREKWPWNPHFTINSHEWRLTETLSLAPICMWWCFHHINDKRTVSAMRSLPWRNTRTIFRLVYVAAICSSTWIEKQWWWDISKHFNHNNKIG